MTTQGETTNAFPEELPAPNIIPLHRAPTGDEPPLPSHLQENAYTELGSEVTWEWNPILAWESLEGTLVGKTVMRLGGTAYILQIDGGEDGEEGFLVLLKRGGRILDSCMKEVEIGDRVYIRYRGLLPAKPGQNHPRDWRVLKLKPV